MLYNLDEITLIPKATTYVKSRANCNVYKDEKLPIFVSPMSCIIDMDNAEKFEKNNLNVIYPRNIPWESRVNLINQGKWVAVGYKEALLLYNIWESEQEYNKNLSFIPHILIDQANGHMNDLLDLCRSFKKLLGDKIVLMVGNVANPETYYCYSLIGVDYVRISVGTGNACTTSTQTGFHYPMGSLLIDIKNYKYYANPVDIKWAKVVADGGFNHNSQIIKALALGADYVMLGKIMAKTVESCGKTQWRSDLGCYVNEYYGMSTEKAQKLIFESSGVSDNVIDTFSPKREEGITSFVEVSYTIGEWVDNFENDLKSAMSYASAFDLDKFIGFVDYDFISPYTYNKIMDK